MKKFIVLLSISFLFPYFATAQTGVSNELSYEVNKIYPYISITKQELYNAQTINAFKNEPRSQNLSYDLAWVKEFISVEILTTHNGQLKKAVSKNDTLTKAQKDLLKMADEGADIEVHIQYLPDNSLSHNEVKKLDFKVAVHPEKEANYPGGEQELKQYLFNNAINKIPNTSFEGYDLSAVKFTINEAGETIDVHIFGAEYQNPRKENVEKVLLDAIKDMPCWTPAEYAEGTKVKQEFVLTVGNMENCMVNLLNIQRD